MIMKKIITALFSCAVVFTLKAQNVVINYKESNEDIINPERGFYIPIGVKASNYVVLNAEQLKNYRNHPQQPGKAIFTVKSSLIYRGYELDIFKNQPLSSAFLSNLQKDFDAVREAGLKMIIRFAYTNSTNSGTCTDEYKICPPYGDAPPNIVFKHIEQLKPILRKNADVIAVMQEGFIGIWGENYFTDYFGDASTNAVGKILDSSWQLRNRFLKSLLDALPKDRMVQVRTPQIKQKFVYGPSASVNSLPLNGKNCFNLSYASRIGFHNDCFLASDDDYGTYYDYGSSTQKRQPANDVLRRYIEADTKYTVAGGETCDDSFSPQNDCAPQGYAEDEMRRLHFSYLNAAYNVDVINDWDSAGCFYKITRHLGYRFILRKALLPSVVKRNAVLKIQMQIENAGYASMYNKRPVILVMKNAESGKEIFLDLKINPQFLFSGIHNIQRTIKLPATVTAGTYQLFLYLPDANVLLRKRQEYCVKLANENLWNEPSGYNSLQHNLQVQ